MFCQQCGAVVGDVAALCPSCHAPTTQVGSGAGTRAGTKGSAADQVKAASRDALAALKTLAGNPVAGLAPAHDALGQARALRVGVLFGVVSMISFLLGGYALLPAFMREDLIEFLGFGGVMKSLFFAIVPFLCTAGGSLVVRKVLGGQGSLAGDAFIAGSALLPASLWIVASGMVGFANAEVIAMLTVFAGCTGILMLFSGFTRISRLSERAGTLAVPVVVILSVWLGKVIATSVLTGGEPSMDFTPMGF